MKENYKPLVLNRAIDNIYISGGWSRYRGHFIYHGKGDLEIKNIPNNTELIIKGYHHECRCGGFSKYRALWKDGVLYNLN